MKKFRTTIGGNGFTIDVDLFSPYLVDTKVTAKQLAKNADSLSKIVNQLNKIITTMPEELWQECNSDIYTAGNLLNNLAGLIGSAHDKKVGA